MAMMEQRVRLNSVVHNQTLVGRLLDESRSTFPDNDDPNGDMISDIGIPTVFISMTRSSERQINTSNSNSNLGIMRLTQGGRNKPFHLQVLSNESHLCLQGNSYDGVLEPPG